MIKGIVYHNGELIKTYEFQKSSVSIGRLPQNDIIINSAEISRTHLEIAYDWEKGAYFANDLNSLNGTLLNGKKITEATRIESGAKLTSGNFAIVLEFIGSPKLGSGEEDGDDVSEQPIKSTGDMFFSMSASKESSSKEDEVESDEKIETKAFFIEANKKIIHRVNKKVMSFGNSQSDDIYIESKVFASENMATLTISEAGYSLQSNTMMVKFKLNGNRVSECLLKNNDRIEFGSSLFTFKLKNK